MSAAGAGRRRPRAVRLGDAVDADDDGVVPVRLRGPARRRPSFDTGRRPTPEAAAIAPRALGGSRDSSGTSWSGAHNAGSFDATGGRPSLKRRGGGIVRRPMARLMGLSPRCTRDARDAKSDHCGAPRTKRAEGRALSVRPSRLIAFLAGCCAGRAAGRPPRPRRRHVPRPRRSATSPSNGLRSLGPLLRSVCRRGCAHDRIARRLQSGALVTGLLQSAFGGDLVGEGTAPIAQRRALCAEGTRSGQAGTRKP